MKEMEEILKSLKDLSLEIIQSQTSDTKTWLNKTSKLYEQLLTLQYLEERQSALNQLEENVKQNITKIIDDSPITPSVKEIEKESPSIETEKLQPDLNSLSGEIRRVPIPQGPPVPQQNLEEILEEEKEEITQEIIEDIKPEPVAKIVEQVEKQKTVTTQTESVVKSATKVSIAEKAVSQKKQSLNDKLSGQALKFGLNDRIAFVKNLFNGSQEDFNRVISQLNTFTTLSEAQNFIEHIVMPEYNWANKEEFSERFMQALENRYA